MNTELSELNKLMQMQIKKKKPTDRPRIDSE